MKPCSRQHFGRLWRTGILVASVALGGCAHSQRVWVDAYACTESLPGQTYRVVAGSGAYGCASLPAATARLRDSIEGMGFVRAVPVENADVTFEFEITMGPGRLVARALPGAPFSADRPGDVRARMDSAVGPTSAGRGFGVAPDAQPPRETTVIRKFTKRLSVVARAGSHEFGVGDGQEELWRTEVTIDDEVSDVAKVLPLMVEAAMARFGIQSSGPVLAAVQPTGIRLLGPQAVAPSGG